MSAITDVFLKRYRQPRCPRRPEINHRWHASVRGLEGAHVRDHEAIYGRRLCWYDLTANLTANLFKNRMPKPLVFQGKFAHVFRERKGQGFRSYR